MHFVYRIIERNSLSTERHNNSSDYLYRINISAKFIHGDTNLELSSNKGFKKLPVKAKFIHPDTPHRKWVIFICKTENFTVHPI